METLTRNKHLAYQGLGDKGNHLCENVSVAIAALRESIPRGKFCRHALKPG
ncbi:MAG: hypothetical protein RL166_52, partial [Actinomycetota bacterium]